METVTNQQQPTTAYSYINNAHPAFLDALYNDYQQKKPLDTTWQRFFEGFEYALNNNDTQPTATNNQALNPTQLQTELQTYALIQAYRQKAHLIAKTNPIRPRKNRNANLELHYFGLQNTNPNTQLAVATEIGLPQNSTLQQIIDKLTFVYCRSIGVEYTYITNPEQYEWIRQKMENTHEYGFNLEKKKRILQKLNETLVFENFLAKRYVGQKRFSLEGGENTIPALDAIVNTCAQHQAEEVVIGMAHRGRLNVLVNLLHKTYEQVFSEFEGTMPTEDATMGSGDVKYHLGYSAQVQTPTQQTVYLKLMPNPSHLEAVNPVVQGFTRAKLDITYNHNYQKIVPILIHGDAAVAGQGIVYEVLQMCKLNGYNTGGTIHLVINNQIGFTTDFDDARSSDSCTSLAAIVKAPVIHVNGDDAEAVVFAAEIAAEFRQKFALDVFIDLVCYRRNGHNEGDDPEYTQPQMYDIIKNHINPRDIYSQKLAAQNEIEAQLAQEMDKTFWAMLQERLDMVKQHPLPYKYQAPEWAWKQLRKATPADFEKSPITGITQTQLNTLTKALLTVPDSFHPLKKINKLIDDQNKLMITDQQLDWGAAELLAYGSILIEKHNVRMSGQDVKRGTFSHRHAVFFDSQNNSEYNRLNYLTPQQTEQGTMYIFNSLLSEYAVLGFEFGYSMATPETLTIWEAQFGDFANGAQTIIDQFVTTCESKWQRNSGIVMLLPHGYEGQGPEHSSARLERFLQACAEDNITVANITSSANFFHALRRQQARPFRKPLIVMTPKKGLRHKLVKSNISEITENTFFKEIIFETQSPTPKRVIMCSGKIFFDLEEYRLTNNITNVAILRMEQLYPLANNQLNELKNTYTNADWVWVQEEPKNMGAWWYISQQLPAWNLTCIARPSAAAPATGFAKQHDKEQAQILQQAFNV